MTAEVYDAAGAIVPGLASQHLEADQRKNEQHASGHDGDEDIDHDDAVGLRWVGSVFSVPPGGEHDPHRAAARPSSTCDRIPAAGY